MKTRIIKTKILDDTKYSALSTLAKHTLLTFLICPEIGLTGCFEANPNLFAARIGCTPQEFFNACKELAEKNFIAMQSHYVLIINAAKHNRYWNGQKNLDPIFAELSAIPRPLKERVYAELVSAMDDSSIDSTMYTTLNTKYKIQNPKRVNINNTETDNIATEVHETLENQLNK